MVATISGRLFCANRLIFLKGKDAMNNPSVIPAFDFREMVTTLDNKIITTSLKVADYFGKRHKDVLRAIRNLKCSDDFTQRNFAPVDFIDKMGMFSLCITSPATDA